METAKEKLLKLLEHTNKEDLKGLSEAIGKVLSGVDLENTEIKAKVSWVLGNPDDPGNYLSFDFKIG